MCLFFGLILFVVKCWVLIANSINKTSIITFLDYFLKSFIYICIKKTLSFKIAIAYQRVQSITSLFRRTTFALQLPRHCYVELYVPIPNRALLPYKCTHTDCPWILIKPNASLHLITYVYLCTTLTQKLNRPCLWHHTITLMQNNYVFQQMN